MRDSIVSIVLVVAMLVTSACAPKMWIRPDTDITQFQKDKDHCQLYSASVSGGNPLIQNSAFKGCMRDRGYELVKGEVE